MMEWLGIDPDFPIFYLIPLLVFGPIFFTILYNFGLKDIINPPPEAREYRRELKRQKDKLKAEQRQKLQNAGFVISGTKKTPAQYLGQVLTYLMFALVLAWFSRSPAYQLRPPDAAEIRLSLTHPGRHKADCRRRSREELQKLAANMRAPMSCARERWPLTVKMNLDGKTVFEGVAPPAGLSKDGHSSFYEKFRVAGRPHTIAVQLWDGDGKGPADYVLEKKVSLSPGKILVIGFNNESKRLILR